MVVVVVVAEWKPVGAGAAGVVDEENEDPHV
jgi:hypothetical protein